MFIVSYILASTIINVVVIIVIIFVLLAIIIIANLLGTVYDNTHEWSSD